MPLSPPTSPIWASIYGRGAAHIKGSVAAFAGAAIDFVRSSPRFKGSISFLITGDEEGPAINGTVKVLEWMKEHGHIPDHCLVGEPSCVNELGDTIKHSAAAAPSFIVTVEGKQGHAAYPHKADNPIPKLARFIDRISFDKVDDGNEHFDPIAGGDLLRRRQSGWQRHPVPRCRKVQHPLLARA